MKNKAKRFKLPKVNERKKMLGIWFVWTGRCWVNEYESNKNKTNA